MIRVLAGLCIIYVICRPVSSNEVLIPVLGTLAVLAAFAWLLHRQRLHPYLQILAYTQVLFGMVGTVIASFNDNPGLVNGALVYLAAPVLFWILVGGATERSLRAALTAIALGTSILSTGIILYVLGQQGVLPAVLPPELLEENGAGFNGQGQATAIRLYGLSSLVAAAPMWVASLFIPPGRLMPKTGLRVYAATTAVIATLVAGRQAIILVVVLTPLLVWLARRLVAGRRPRTSERRSTRVGPMAAAILLLAGLVAAFPKLVSTTAITDAFRALGHLLLGADGRMPAVDAEVRRYQAGRLIEEWWQSPLWGHGFGAVINGYSRNDDRPWNFELQYHLLLFQTGLLGVIFCAVVAVLVTKTLRLAATLDPALVGTLTIATTGALAILVANATNPYLQAPGHMWAVYLPLAVANVMVNRPAPKAERTGAVLASIR